MVGGESTCKNQQMIEQLERAELGSSGQAGFPAEGKRAARVAPLAFAATVLLSAFLLFEVQLIIGKYILPLFGGAPSVWNTCMLFFQVLLLLGYGYSHFLASRFQPRAQRVIHALLRIVSTHSPTPALSLAYSLILSSWSGFSR